jgi:uroporphyrinogen-III synthase
MRPLIVLRPEPGASRTAAQAAEMGLDARLVPLFFIVPIPWSAPDPAGLDGLVLTSANAIRHGGEELGKLQHLPVYAVGQATASLARAAGFDVASVGEGGGRDMTLPAGKKLLHLAGADHGQIAAAQTIAVYEARPIDEPARLAEIKDCVAAVHSSRAGARLAELVDDRSTVRIAAISAAAAKACGGGWRQVEAAFQPNDSALLALAARLCESPR